MNKPVRIEQLRIEQVRKRGLPPPLLGLEERGQAPLPDLFYFYLFIPSDLFISRSAYTDWLSLLNTKFSKTR